MGGCGLVCILGGGGGEVRRGYWDFWDEGGRIVAGQWMCVGILRWVGIVVAFGIRKGG